MRFQKIIVLLRVTSCLSAIILWQSKNPREAVPPLAEMDKLHFFRLSDLQRVNRAVGLQKEFKNSNLDETIQGLNESIIADGIIKPEKYFNAKPRILWVLKEPYDEAEGGWHYRNLLLPEERYSDVISSKTLSPLIYISHALLNNFMEWKEIPFFHDNEAVYQSCHYIGIINISKMPGPTISKHQKLQTAYNEFRDIILKQLSAFEPDIVIGGNTLRYLFEDLGISEDNINKNSPKLHFAVKDETLYIDAYHPSVRANTITQEDYANGIISLAKEFWINIKGPD